jgi:hypothetical protein
VPEAAARLGEAGTGSVVDSAAVGAAGVTGVGKTGALSRKTATTGLAYE